MIRCTTRRSVLVLSIACGIALGCGDSGRSDPNTIPPNTLPGNPDGSCTIPADAMPVDTSSPTHVIGDGTPASCTSDLVVNTIAMGGIITFDCGPDPIKITLDRTAQIFNRVGKTDVTQVVIDGGGKVTLSGGGTNRILYMNTCDQNLVWTTPTCQNQEFPQVTVQNLTFVDGYVGGTDDRAGGGAIWARGGRLKIINSRFYDNQCSPVGQDVGGGAVRAFDQYNDLPLYVVGSTFGDDAVGFGNVCSNGGALSSIGVSYTVLNSVFVNNRAIGDGANPAQPGTPGGGSGGAIYNDGNTFTLTICGTEIRNNTANEGGGAIFFVSSDRSGFLVIQNSMLSNNPSAGFETQGYPGIFVLANGDPIVTGSTIQ